LLLNASSPKHDVPNILCSPTGLPQRRATTNAMAVCVINIGKQCFCMIYFFPFIPRGRDLGNILVSFGDPGNTFSDFSGVLETDSKFDDFLGVPWESPG
jgi:hypothetical protein